MLCFFTAVSGCGFLLCLGRTPSHFAYRLALAVKRAPGKAQRSGFARDQEE